MQQYLDLCQRILDHGEQMPTRTGIDTIGIFGAMMQYDLRHGFPLLTTKRVLFDTVVDELLWFVRGGHNIHDSDAPKKIWDSWANENGDLGLIYGTQWRHWGATIGFLGYDQLQLAIDRIKTRPNSRQNLVSAWNVADIEEGLVGFLPCHVMYQWRVMGRDKQGTPRLDLAMYQRSCDMAIGVPFNIASYALLLIMVANECNLVPGVFTHFLADAHIYVNHIETLYKQLQHAPRPLPQVMLISPESGDELPVGYPVVDICKEHILLSNYTPHGFLKYEVAV